MTPGGLKASETCLIQGIAASFARSNKIVIWEEGRARGPNGTESGFRSETLIREPTPCSVMLLAPFGFEPRAKGGTGAVDAMSCKILQRGSYTSPQRSGWQAGQQTVRWTCGCSLWLRMRQSGDAVRSSADWMGWFAPLSVALTCRWDHAVRRNEEEERRDARRMRRAGVRRTR